MFDLQSYFSKKRGLIEKALRRSVPGPGIRPALLHKAINYSVFSGGKRIRPVLCAAAAEVCGGKQEKAFDAGVALELLHTYTLIHDDLPCMDDDVLRRGKPTCHVAFGESTALLAGDALQAMAFEVLAASKLPPETRAQLVAELAAAAGSTGVVGGQVEDLALKTGKPTVSKINYIHYRKTALLFRAAARMGAISAGAGPRNLKRLTDYGQCIGLAFQLADDILDDIPAEKKNSKGRLDKSSSLMVYAPEIARNKARKLIRRAIAALEGLPGDPEPLTVLAEFVVERAY